MAAPSSAPALARSLRAITLGTLTGYNDRHDAQVAEAIGEVDRQYQLQFASTGDGKDVLDALGNTPEFYTGGIVPPDLPPPPDDGSPTVSIAAITPAAVLLPSAQPEPAYVPPELDPTADTKTLTQFWRTLTLTFDAPFTNGTEDRDVPFLTPIFTYGYELIVGRGIVVNCHLLNWNFDDESEYLWGAQIEYGAFRPNGHILGHFVAVIHLNFQGWATPNPPEDPDSS